MMPQTIDDSFAEMTVEELYQRLKPIARSLMLRQDPDRQRRQPHQPDIRCLGWMLENADWKGAFA